MYGVVPLRDIHSRSVPAEVRLYFTMLVIQGSTMFNICPLCVIELPDVFVIAVELFLGARASQTLP